MRPENFPPRPPVKTYEVGRVGYAWLPLPSRAAADLVHGTNNKWLKVNYSKAAKATAHAAYVASMPQLRNQRVAKARISLYWYLGDSKLEAKNGPGGKPIESCYRPRDLSNALQAFKPYQDALEIAGIICSDAHTHLEIGTIAIFSTAREHRGASGIEVVIEELIEVKQ
jgi:hypothetical protein